MSSIDELPQPEHGRYRTNILKKLLTEESVLVLRNLTRQDASQAAVAQTQNFDQTDNASGDSLRSSCGDGGSVDIAALLALKTETPSPAQLETGQGRIPEHVYRSVSATTGLQPKTLDCSDSTFVEEVLEKSRSQHALLMLRAQEVSDSRSHSKLNKSRGNLNMKNIRLNGSKDLRKDLKLKSAMVQLHRLEDGIKDSEKRLNGPKNCDKDLKLKIAKVQLHRLENVIKNSKILGKGLNVPKNFGRDLKLKVAKVQLQRLEDVMQSSKLSTISADRSKTCRQILTLAKIGNQSSKFVTETPIQLQVKSRSEVNSKGEDQLQSERHSSAGRKRPAQRCSVEDVGDTVCWDNLWGSIGEHRLEQRAQALPSTVEVTRNDSNTITLKFTLNGSNTNTVKLTPSESNTNTVKLTPSESNTNTVKLTPSESNTNTVKLTPSESNSNTNISKFEPVDANTSTGVFTPSDSNTETDKFITNIHNFSFSESNASIVQLNPDDSDSDSVSVITSPSGTKSSTKTDKISPDLGMLQCTICGKEFRDRIKLNLHIHLHKQQHKCSVCSLVCPDREQLNQHEAQHKIVEMRSVGTQHGSLTPNPSERSLAQEQLHPTQIVEVSEIEQQNLPTVEHEMLDKRSVGTQHDSFVRPQEEEGKQSKVIVSPQHKQNTVSVTPQHRCPVCPKLFPEVQQLIQHATSHKIVIKELQYMCTVCGKIYPDMALLSQHASQHKVVGDDPVHTCHVCSKVCTSLEELTQHINQKHLPRALYVKPNHVCQVCNKIFRDQTSLQRHTLDHLPNTVSSVPTKKDKVFLHRCKKCPRLFETEQEALNHQLFHTDIYRCDRCSITFHSKPTLYYHNLRHHPRRFKGYECKVCGQQFRNAHIRNYHLNSHEHLKNFFCEICGKGYVLEGQLNSHLWSHRNVRQKLCEFCGKLFKTKKTLETHRGHHLGIKRYICEVCGKKLASKDGYKSHVLSHKGPPPFKCDLCDSGYYIACNLRNHMKTKHNIESYVPSPAPV